MTRWYSEKKHEHYYKTAKKQGYRSRSSYKLKQIQKKYHILSKGDYILDLGAAPGGWSQVAWENCRPTGKVIGVDLAKIIPLQDVIFLQSDVTKESTIHQIMEIIQEHVIDVVLSDLAPNISGNYSFDHIQSVFLSSHAFQVVEQLLKPNGHFVCKIFMGDTFPEFLNTIKQKFRMVHCYSPPASRKRSSEIYIIGKLYRKD